MIGDILTCLIVILRLFFITILVINVVAWLLFSDDDDDDVRQAPGSPDSPRTREVVTCPLCVRRPATSRRPPPDRQNGGSAPPTCAPALVIDFIGRLGASEEPSGDEKRSVYDGTTTADEVDGTADDIADRARNVGQVFPAITAASASDAGHEGRTMADRQEVFIAKANNHPQLMVPQQQEQGSHVDDEDVSLGDEEVETTATDAAQPDRTVAAGSVKTPKPTPRVKTTDSAARRPASHW